MWDLPGPGLEPVSPALAGGFLTTAPPGKSERFGLGGWFFGYESFLVSFCVVSEPLPVLFPLLLVFCCGYFHANLFHLYTDPVYTAHFLSHDHIYTFDGYI